MAKWNDGKYWVSKYNYDEEFTSGLNIAPKVEIHDATLRDGEQTPRRIYEHRPKGGNCSDAG